MAWGAAREATSSTVSGQPWSGGAPVPAGQAKDGTSAPQPSPLRGRIPASFEAASKHPEMRHQNILRCCRLLPPASTPPVRRPRQRPSQISGRGAPLPPSLSPCAIRRAPECFFCFVSRAQRCRGHLTGGEESGDRRRPEDASLPTSPTSDKGVGGRCRE